MNRFILTFAAAALLAGCAPGMQRHAPPPPATLKVASWKLEHLAEHPGTGCRPRSEPDYRELARHAQTLDADVIAFQEVESEAAAARVFDPARYDIIMSQRPASRRGGGCYGVPGQQIRHQGVGFAIRKGVSWIRNPDLGALALGNPDLRWGVDITLTGRTPLRLLAIHLKSGCNSGRAPSDADCPVLFAQLPVLESWIEARASRGEAFAVLGDWNRRIASHGDAFFADLNDGEPGETALTLASGQRAAACKVRYREFIDHIATGTRATRQAVPGSFEEFTYGGAEVSHPSDHCPISLRFNRQADARNIDK